MLSLVTYGPSYVSPNTIVGYEEAKKFFPETYMSAEEEYAEQLKLQEAEKNNAKVNYITFKYIMRNLKFSISFYIFLYLLQMN